MSTLAGVVLLVALLIVIAATVVTYYGLWRVWQAIPRERPRKYLVWEAVGFGVGGLLLALMLAAPWGKHTVAYVLLTLGVVTILCSLIGAAGAAIQSRRPHDRT